ncbi:MAG: DNA adenine methylase [Candidatus Aenigmarchaeota archaeon]|nr:DNA adenine methylase [Candidatus Aenigmarchaeota archaeon]
MTYYSPLRYPGGKTKIVPFIRKLIAENDLVGGTYVEPYAGGAGAALSLLFDGVVQNIIINDIDSSIYAFWYSVLNKTEEFCSMIKKLPVTVDEWKRQKNIQSAKTDDVLKLGFSTFFLNRTNISGILNGGPIGGIAQNGKWKIDARYNKSDLIKRIKRIEDFKDKIKLYNIDAIELIENLSDSLPSKTLIYFDPPYYIKGENLYMNHYDQDDHAKISEKMKNITNHKWIITYDNVNAISKLYRLYRKRSFKLNYTAGKTTKGIELMIFSNNMNIENMQNIPICAHT